MARSASTASCRRWRHAQGRGLSHRRVRRVVRARRALRLNAGFDVYDDRYGSRSAGGDLSVLERPADATLDAAAALDRGPAPARRRRRGSRGCTSTIPHEPYDPPEPYRSRISRLTRTPARSPLPTRNSARRSTLLKSRGQLDHTLVVVAADHGESLGEHQERTHGLFAYDATLRVPLVVWAPAAVTPGVLTRTGAAGGRDADGARPGRRAAPGASGRSLWPFARDGQPLPTPTSTSRRSTRT